jgi:hypothetical protein
MVWFSKYISSGRSPALLQEYLVLLLANARFLQYSEITLMRNESDFCLVDSFNFQLALAHFSPQTLALASAFVKLCDSKEERERTRSPTCNKRSFSFLGAMPLVDWGFVGDC